MVSDKGPSRSNGLHKQRWVRTYCAQCQNQDQGSDVYECVVGAPLARATLWLCVGHIVALRELSQEPLGREVGPGDVYAHTRSRSASAATSNGGARIKQSTRTGR